MRSQLDKIKNWPELVQKADYKPRVLARLAGTCLRQFQRWLRLKKNMTPGEFCASFRQNEAAARLVKGNESKKEIAAALAYSKATNFSRDFRKFYSLTPTAYQESRGPAPGA